MSKGVRIFVNILYYLLTFGIGILIAVSLPASMIYTGSMKAIKEYLNNGEYDKALMSVGGYYDKEYVYLNDDKNLVIFNTVTLVYTGSDSDVQVDGEKIHKAYFGYFFNVKENYKTVKNGEENQTRLIITDNTDSEHKYNLIDYDYTQDGKVDSIATLVSYDFLFFEIPIEETNSIKTLTFYDADGNVYKEFEFATPLTFSEQFFVDVDDFVEEYNRDYTSGKLLELDEEFLAKSGNYQKSSNGDIVKKVNTKVTLLVLLYFVVIYLIGDSLIGGHFVIKGLIWLFRKIFKRKQNENNNVKTKEFTGTMYSSFTIMLDVEPDFSEPVTVTYSNNNDSIEYYLLKEDDYKMTKRIKSGTYMNLKVLMSNKYEVLDAKEVITIEKFNERETIKIRKKKGEEE